MPFTVRDGRAKWELTTSSDRLSELGEHLDEAGIEYDIESVVEIGSSEAERLLTPRQREVLAVVIEEGYYAVPRDATLTDVAETLGVSKSTCSDILQLREQHHHLVRRRTVHSDLTSADRRASGFAVDRDANARCNSAIVADGDPLPLELSLDTYDVSVPTGVVDELKEIASYEEENHHRKGRTSPARRHSTCPAIRR